MSSLQNGIRKISIAPGGIVPTGFDQVTKNSFYYACASKYSILFFQLPDFIHCETMCQGASPFRMIRLSSSNFSLIAILYLNEQLQLYDFIEKTVYDQVAIKDRIFWMEFNHSSTMLTLFSTAQIHQYNVQDKTIKTISMLKLPPVRFFCNNPEMENISIMVSNANSILTLNLNEKSPTTSDNQSHRVTCIKFDPLNSLNCLMISKSPTWKVFTYLPTFNIIAQSKERDDLRCLVGDWIRSLPGHILTCDKIKGIVYIWSVATGEIVESLNIYRCGALSIFSINEKDFVLTFEDGSIGVLDIQRKQLIKTIECAHTSTVFSCQFLPTDGSVFVTASSDGKIVLWNSPSLSVRDKFEPKKRMQFLCVCFSPGGGYTACGTPNGELFVYSVKEHRQIYQGKIHHGRVIGVSWCPHNNDLIATSGEDKTCKLFSLNAMKVKATISIKNQLKRLQWSHTTESIAIACADGSLYVRMEGGAYQVIKSNDTKKPSPLFAVDWHPKDDKRVAATDDAGNVMVFNLEHSNVTSSSGHEGQARPCCWSENIDYLLFSGGYDGKMILWDTRNMSKIMIVQAHSTHIYGLSTHKDYPMLIASASRDETVRIWSIDRLFPEYKIDAILNDERFTIQKYCNYDGCNELLKLLHRVMHDGTKIAFSSNELCHTNDVLRIAKKRISKLTSALPSDHSTILRARNAQKSIKEAAELSMKCGDIKRACELLFLAGEYNLALSFAPAVSYRFWQNLVLMRSEMLKGSDESAIHAVIAGKPELAAEQLVELNDFTSAELICAAMRENDFTPRSKTVRANDKKIHNKNHKEKMEQTETVPEPFLRTDFDEANDFNCYLVASQQSLDYARDGKPLFAAAALLTVGDAIGAAWRLFHCGEICWAMEVIRCLNDETLEAPIREEFVKYCIAHNRGERAFDLLSQSAKRRLVNLLNFNSEKEKYAFFEKHKLKSPEQYALESSRMKGHQKIQALILAGKQKEAETQAIAMIRSLMSSNFYDYTEVKTILSIVQNSENVSDELAAISHYFGAYEAMWKGYDDIVERLIVAVQELKVDWLNDKINELQIVAALTLSKNSVNIGQKYIQTLGSSAKNVEAFDGIMKLDPKLKVNGGATVKCHGSGIIPNDMESIIKTSICTGNRITGNVYYFEDENSTVSEDESIMWYEVSPFSPLKTHKRFNPF